MTETWTNPNLIKAEFELQGYRLEWRHRQDTCDGRGGGVAIYIKQDLVYKEIEIQNEGIEFNLIGIEIVQKGKKT